MYPLFTTLASSSHLPFHGLLTSLFSVTNIVKSSASYFVTFLFILPLPPSLDFISLLFALFWNTVALFGTLPHLLFLTLLNLSNSLLSRLPPDSVLLSSFFFNLNSISPPYPLDAIKLSSSFFLNCFIILYICISNPPTFFPPSYPLRSFHPNNFICPISQKSSFYHSCIPSAIRLWNSLPSLLNELPPSLFSTHFSKN